MRFDPRSPRTLALALLAGLALVWTCWCVPAAQAAPARSNSSNETVYFVHGLSVPSASSNCASIWGSAMNRFRALGWSGVLKTVAYYTDDKACTTRIGSNSLNTSITELGRQLAWTIYNENSKAGRSVDLVGHSMGGLVVRAAISGTARHLSGFPPYVYVEDAITLSTPHNGTSFWARACSAYRQCQEMVPGSSFLKSLLSNAQASGGTDWTLVGTEDDDQVPVATATIETGAGHYVWYFAHQAHLEHSDVTSSVAGTYKFRFRNHQSGSTWYATTAGQPVIDIARNAAYYWSDR